MRGRLRGEVKNGGARRGHGQGLLSLLLRGCSQHPAGNAGLPRGGRGQEAMGTALEAGSGAGGASGLPRNVLICSKTREHTGLEVGEGGDDERLLRHHGQWLGEGLGRQG